MKGEHCVAGATILSAFAVILLIFAHIGQISSGALVKSIYMAEINVEAYGNAIAGVANSTSADGLYDTKNDAMGKFSGLRQYYRYGLYNACSYQKSGSGICNSTTFAYPMAPLADMVGDVPPKYRKQTVEIIPSCTFKNTSYNKGMTRAGSGLIFIGSVFALAALIFGVIKFRLAFFIAAVCSGSASFFLMLGAALWTAVIAKDAWLERVKVQYGYKLGILVNAGPSLYLTWVAFACITLSTLPYVIACCTYRK